MHFRRLTFPLKVRQAKPGEGGWYVEVNRHIETFCRNSQVQVLPRQRLATGWDRVLRGARAISAAKRTQRVCRPRD
jgi:hypothetical protein